MTPSQPAKSSMIDSYNSLDGVTFSVIVSRRQDESGEWLVRVFAPSERECIFDHTTAGYTDSLVAAGEAMAEWVRTHGGGPR